MSSRRSHEHDPAALAEALLRGNRLALARALTLVENEQPAARALLSTLFPQTGRAHIVGVTGAPGTGKSTLVTALARGWRTRGCTVGIVAVDPSSPFTGGALLGDRVRMRTLSGDAGVFIRSMATRGSLGGLAKTTNDAVMLLDAAGFDLIIVETVGVGQAEVEIASTAHTTLVVEAPGLGDEVQAIKAGILEIADLLVVNKADRPGADRTQQALALTLEVQTAPTSHASVIKAGWQVPVLKTVAADGAGVDALLQQIEAHRTWLDDSGEIEVRERRRLAHMLESILRSELSRRVAAALPHGNVEAVIDALRKRTVDPYQAVDRLLARSELLDQ